MTEPGSTIAGRYRLDAFRLGHGGMGEVWEPPTSTCFYGRLLLAP